MLGRLATRFGTSLAAVPAHYVPPSVLQGRYDISHLLGKGQQSTVWHAHDRERQVESKDTFLSYTENLCSNCDVAIKIFTSEMTAIQGDEAFELEIAQRISRLPDTCTLPGRRHLLTSSDSFAVTGNGGRYQCLVTELLGVSLLHDSLCGPSEARRQLPLPLVKTITFQMLQALQTLHDECQVVHTDIKHDNILRRPSDDSFILADYGSGMPLSELSRFPDRQLQPPALRCPEVIVGCPWDTKADIWNLGCMVFELATARRLFNPSGTAQYSAEQYHLARIYATFVHEDTEVERLRDSLFSKGRHFDAFFRAHGGLIVSIARDHHESLNGILKVYGIESAPLESLLTDMLRVHPGDRPSVKELLSHPFFAPNGKKSST
ncbi:Kinase-like protein [Mycena indigotica]|uniref:non-specific serine/threonine protein kinase n=1 Tax=Mycena indigotica TaxID=2126181 RepID=A0A8H6SCP6_9AGAR|nr:Kinase-like protein [Mycena indigotica]KAF7295450.1 Kinase-like protein [Mycena indigotica]